MKSNKSSHSNQTTLMALKVCAGAAVALMAFGAQAGQIVIQSGANCILGDGNSIVYSISYESPVSGRWQFGTLMRAANSAMPARESIVEADGSGVGNAYAGAVVRSSPFWRVYGTHVGFDGIASYGFSTWARTCPGQSKVFEMGAQASTSPAAMHPASGGFRIGSINDLGQTERELLGKHAAAPAPAADLAPGGVQPQFGAGASAFGAWAKALRSKPAAEMPHQAKVGKQPPHAAGVQLGATELGQARLLANSEAPTNAKAFGSYRAFDVAGDVIVLHEWDLAASGVTAVGLRERFNTNVNGNPARIQVSRGLDGSSLTALVWFRGNHRFELESNGASANEGERLLHIARSLN